MSTFLIVDIIISLSIAAPVVAAWYFFRKQTSLTKAAKEIIATAAFISLICVVGYFISDSKYKARAQSYFFEGHLEKVTVFVEGDGETVDHDEDRFVFRNNDAIATDAKGIVQFFLLFVIFGGFAVSFYCWAISAREKEAENNNETYLIAIRIILTTVLLLCLLRMPEWYYDKMRFVILIGCIYLNASFLNSKHFGGWLFFIAVAILFNPLEQIHLTRLLWHIIDITVAIVLLTGAIKMYIDQKT